MKHKATKLTEDGQADIPIINDAYGSALHPADYKIVIGLNEDVSSKILKIKSGFASQYNCPEAMHIKPQVTLAVFSQFEMMEWRIVNKIKSIAEGLHPFQLEVEDFTGIPSHTIAFNIASKVELNQLTKTLKQGQRLMTIDKQNKVLFINDPNIIIANKLLPWQYEKALVEYSNTHFKAACMVTELLLLKRKRGNKGFTLVEKFGMLNRSTKVEQVRMF